MAMTASRSRPVSGKTSLYVYGVTRAGAAAASRGAGIGGADVDAVEHGELAAVVSPVPEGPVRAKRRDLMRHMDVLRDVFAASTVLPLQFGSVFPNVGAVADGLLAQRHDELVDLLQRFDGLAELRVRAAYREDVVLAEIVQGDARIARLRDRIQGAGAEADPLRLQLGEAVARTLTARRERDAHTISRMLLPLARDAVVEEPRTEYELMRASYLVEQRQIPEFDSLMEELARTERERTAFTYAGPLPPHSFVGLSHGGG